MTDQPKILSQEAEFLESVRLACDSIEQRQKSMQAAVDKAREDERDACVATILATFQGWDRASGEGWLCNEIIRRIRERWREKDDAKTSFD